MNSRAIFTLWKREMIRFYRNKSRIVGGLAQSLFFLLAMGFGLGRFQVGNVGYSVFIAPGILSIRMLFASIFFGVRVIMDKQFGFLKEVLVSPVKRVEIMAGKVLGGATISLVQCFLVVVIAMLLGFLSFPTMGSVITTVLILAVSSVGFVSLGILIATRMSDMHGFQLVMNFLMQPMFLFSGALFPIDDLPRAISPLVTLNPLTYTVDALRNALIGQAANPLAFDLVVVTLFAAAMLGLGAYSFEKMK